jgi:TolB-like protein
MHGESATPRSDVYSLGIVLYELLCGERPSLRTVQGSASHGDPKEGHLSPRLRAIVFNAIRLDPEERYASAKRFAEDLQRYLDGAPPVTSAHDNRDKVSIGILPFRQLSIDGGADPFFGSALVDSLVARLSKVDRLSVRPTSAVLKYAHRNDAVRAGRELRVQCILEGTLHAAGQDLRLNAQLVSTETGVAVWAGRFEERAQDLLGLEDSISEQIAYAVIPQLTGEEEFQLKRSGTASGKAHDAYLRGRFHWNRSAGEPDELVKALVYFMEAIAEDPEYAAAHAGVADTI